MNLGQAVAVCLYELARPGSVPEKGGSVWGPQAPGSLEPWGAGQQICSYSSPLQLS